MRLPLSNGADCDKIRDRIVCRWNKFVESLRLGSTPVTTNGPIMPHRHPGNANLCFRGLDARNARCFAATGAACATRFPNPPHALRAIGISAEECDSAIRLSFGHFAADEEISVAVELAVKALNATHANSESAVNSVENRMPCFRSRLPTMNRKSLPCAYRGRRRLSPRQELLRQFSEA